MIALPKNCLSVAQAAEFLNVQPLTVRRLITDKKLKASRVGRRIVVTPAALNQFLEDHPA